ncbi:MAG: CfrBI family restriction endonuclease [Gemmatimonadota bacterium]|nr:CfrBI family restriction endonuclease [Gemmatimonadota bacterium]
MFYETLSGNIPRIGESLAKYRGVEVIDRIGEDIVKEAVTSVLCGGNIRSLTEGLTRRRLTLLNAALFVTFLKSGQNIENFVDKIPEIVKTELRSRTSDGKKLFLEWCIGLTGKSIQNVLRNSEKEFDNYLNALEESLKQSTDKCKIDYGELEGILKIHGVECKVDWPFILYLFAAIGTQTLAIRGSEKSMYGKFFEKLILGSLLSLLGFRKIDSQNTDETDKVFWLSERGEKRESDATLLYKLGVGVRFDIGFIGPGNTEISLDKVSRFDKVMKLGRQTHYMSTIIVVDRIGDGSRIVKMAREIGGDIVQMSMTHWTKEVAGILAEKFGFEHPILYLSNRESLEYIKEGMKQINLREFIRPRSYSTGRFTF